MKVYAHQWPLVAVIPWTYADVLVTAVAIAIANLPGDSIVIGGDITVDVATNFGTSCTLDIGDDADPDRYTSSPVDLQSTGRTALTLTGYKMLVTDDLIATPVIVGAAATAGSGRIIIQYVREGRSNEVRT